MRILLFANSSWNLYNFRIGLIKELVNKKSQIFFLGQNDIYSKKLIKLKIKYLNLFLNQKSKNPFKEIFTLVNFFYILKKNKPDYILSFTIKPNLYTLFAAFFFKTKVIINITGLGNTFINNNLFTNIIILFYKFLLRNAYFIYFQNIDDLNYFNKLNLLNNLKYDVLPGSGINLNFFNNVKKNNFNNNIHFVFVGRTIKQKGIYEFCEASKIIINTFKNISFSIIGFGEYNHLDKKYTHINFVYSKDIDKLSYINYDCLILPSYREGLPRTVLEFSLLGIPSIVTDVPGCREIIKDNYNGFLCKPFSTKNLILCIEKFLNLSLNEKIKMSYNAKYYVEKNFDEKLVINKYLDILYGKK